jgi:hypothetical protein
MSNHLYKWFVERKIDDRKAEGLDIQEDGVSFWNEAGWCGLDRQEANTAYEQYVAMALEILRAIGGKTLRITLVKGVMYAGMAVTEREFTVTLD